MLHFYLFMQLLTKEELDNRKEEIIEKILNGAIFIYPTDTIYGIGCNALIDDSVKRMITKLEKMSV